MNATFSFELRMEFVGNDKLKANLRRVLREISMFNLLVRENL